MFRKNSFIVGYSGIKWIFFTTAVDFSPSLLSTHRKPANIAVNSSLLHQISSTVKIPQQ